MSQQPCPVCHGQGVFIDHPCSECGGLGRQQHEDKLKVTIPAGVEEGMALRIPGHGLPSEEAGGETGDLYVIVRTAPDPRFQRQGADLWRTETLQIPDAVLGTTLKIDSLDGPLDVKVPHGSQPGEILRLRGKGIPETSGHAAGDLVLRETVVRVREVIRSNDQLKEHIKTGMSEVENAMADILSRPRRKIIMN